MFVWCNVTILNNYKNKATNKKLKNLQKKALEIIALFNYLQKVVRIGLKG